MHLTHQMLCMCIPICCRVMRNQLPGICLGPKFYWSIPTIQQGVKYSRFQLDNLYLVRGLKAPHMRRRVASEQESWRMMEDVFNNIDLIAKTEDRNKIYLEPNLKSVPQVAREWVQKVSTVKYPRAKPNP